MQVDEEDANMLEVGADEEDAVADGVAEDAVQDAEDAADEDAEDAADEVDDDDDDAAEEDNVSLPGDDDAVEIPSAPLTDAETGDGETVRLSLYDADLSLTNAYVMQEVDVGEFNVSVRFSVLSASLTDTRTTPSTCSPERSHLYA